jgi:hypothetical protein
LFMNRRQTLICLFILEYWFKSSIHIKFQFVNSTGWLV